MSSSESDIISMFGNHLETCEITEDFKTFWGQKWKGITQTCLNVARHQFVMRKASEIFKAKYELHVFTNKSCLFSSLFVVNEERAILKGLCKHVGLNFHDFIYLGMKFHRLRCINMLNITDMLDD